jgi:hypothetical protein
MPSKRTFNVSDIPRTRQGIVEVITDRRSKSGVRHREVPIELPRKARAGKASSSKKSTQTRTEQHNVKDTGGPLFNADDMGAYEGIDSLENDLQQFDLEETHAQPTVWCILYCISDFTDED